MCEDAAARARAEKMREMKPLKKSVVIQCWDCGNHEHQHSNYGAAFWCMNNQDIAETSTYGEIRALKIMAANAVANGISYKDAGGIIGKQPITVRKYVSSVIKSYNWSCKDKAEVSLEDIEEDPGRLVSIVDVVAKLWSDRFV